MLLATWILARLEHPPGLAPDLTIRECID